MKKDHQSRFHEMFSSTSTNFCGSGLTMQEFMQLGVAEKVETAWFRQEQEERKRRLHFVMELCDELANIKATTIFATGLCEMAIESIIDGNWKMVKEWAEDLSFSNETPEVRQRYASVYARVSELLQHAYETRPGQFEAKA